jgi:hypothetical protein
MKAQLVSENVNFERGRNPKEAMGLGIVQDVSDTLEALDSFDYNDDLYLVWVDWTDSHYIEIAVKNDMVIKSDVETLLQNADLWKYLEYMEYHRGHGEKYFYYRVKPKFRKVFQGFKKLVKFK